MMRFLNKQNHLAMKQMVAVITGATGGIGSAIAKALAAEGATVILVSRDQQKLASLQQEILSVGQGESDNLYTIAADLLNPKAFDDLSKQLKDFSPKVNVLINNAGTNRFGLFEHLEGKNISQILQLNVDVPMRLCHSLLPHLKQQHCSQIINIGSTFGSIGYPGFCSYSASKFALRGFSEALSRELADTKVQVKYLSPRATKTAFNNSRVEQLNKATHTAMDSPDVVAQATVKLLKQSGRSLALGWPEALFTTINQIFPSIVSKAINKDLATIKRYAQL